MLEHADEGSAVKLPVLPPPPLVLVVVVSPLPSLVQPPPHPAAMNASAEKTPMNATALKLVLTLVPPPSPGCANRVWFGAVSGLGRLDATLSGCRWMRCTRGTPISLVPREPGRSGGTGIAWGDP